MAVEGVSTNINIQCNLGRQGVAPFWIINGSVYELFSIPVTFLPLVTPIPMVESYSALTIPMVTVDLNETTFQCALFSENGVIFGRITRIIVIPSKYLCLQQLDPISSTHIHPLRVCPPPPPAVITCMHPVCHHDVLLLQILFQQPIQHQQMGQKWRMFL